MFLGLGLCVWVCVTASSCTRALFVPPAGPGAPAPEAAAAWAEATAGCRTAQAYVAALRVSGRFGSERLWPVSIEAAVTADRSIYLGANAGGQSVFVLAGTANRATLWLRRDERVVAAAPADIMDAIVGVSIPPDQLLAVLTGCVARSFDMTRAARHGRLLSVDTSDARLHLEQRDGQWRVKFAETDAFVVEFGAHDGALPKEIWMWSVRGRVPAASLRFVVTDPEVNGQIDPAVFQLPRGAAAASPLTLEELRAAGPWKDAGRSPGR